MAATASCVMAMGHIGQSKPGLGLSRFVAPRCATEARWARRTKSLDALLPVLYLRGVSAGDFQEALAALLGKDAPNLSPAVISRLTAEWEADYDAWQKRDLSARRYVYVWADGICLQARMEDCEEGFLLYAWLSHCR
jgi:transposase-like protein